MQKQFVLNALIFGHKPFMIKSPLFLLGLLLRILLLVCILPKATAIWYAPFMELSTSEFSLNPWGVYLAQGGSSIAFPYGYVMWLIFLPLTLMAKLIHIPTHYGYGATLILVDFGLLLTLRSILFRCFSKDRSLFLLSVYWLSPILLLATYWLGFNDLVPVFLLCLAIYFTQRIQFFWAGVFLAMGISAKLSTGIALPFFLLYLIRNKSLQTLLPFFFIGFLLSATLVILPTLILPASFYMLFHNPELEKIYQFSLQIGDHLVVYILPFFYLLMLYGAWKIKRLNFELFQVLLGLGFLGLVLLTPAALGWFIWILPLLVFYQSYSDKLAMGLVALFALLYVLAALLPDYVFHFHSTSMLRTAMLALGFILAIRIWRETLSRNDYFKLSQKPFVLGIAGDSGAGKDTLANALKGLFGAHSVASLSGDDYHLWDRQKPMWQVMTHLNPKANDLDRFTEDVLALTQRKSISLPHYNHSTGQMTRPFRLHSNDFVIISGLHALFLPTLSESYNLSIYLDIDEHLRRYYKLKRDVEQRGHSLEKVLDSLAKRESDSIKFIKPQAKYADLILSLQPIHPDSLSLENPNPPKIKLSVRSRSGINEQALIRVLIGISGLHIDMEVENLNFQEIAFTIEGDPSHEDIELAAGLLFPKILAFLDRHPKWESGALGLMQLVVLSHIHNALNRRLLW